MNKYLLGGLLLTATLAQAQDNAPATQYAETITPADLKKHLVIIASDSLEGRDTGSPGQKKAADYVVEAFQTVRTDARRHRSRRVKIISSEV